LAALKLESKELYRKWAACNEHSENKFRMYRTITHDFFSDELYSDPFFWMMEKGEAWRSDYVLVQQVYQYEMIVWLCEQGVKPYEDISLDFMKTEIKRYDPKGTLIEDYPKLDAPKA
jgi:hypothetical protein